MEKKQEIANSSLYNIVSHHITVVQCHGKKTPTASMNESENIMANFINVYFSPHYFKYTGSQFVVGFSPHTTKTAEKV